MKRLNRKFLLTVHAFFPRHYHGTERYTLDLAKSLQRMGHDAVVVTVNPYPEDSDGGEWFEYEFEGVRVLSIDLVPFQDFSLRATYERPQIPLIFRKILRQEKPDLVHCCHLLNLGANLIEEATNVQLPVVCTFTDFFGICWTNRLTTVHGEPCLGPAPDSINCVADFFSSSPFPTNNDLVNRILPFGRHVPYIWKCFAWWANSNAGRGLQPPVMDIQLRKNRLYKYYQAVDRFIVATDFLKHAYIRSGYPPDRFTKITFGVIQPTEQEKTLLSSRYKAIQNGEPFVFGFIGQVARHKGIDLLVQAFQDAGLPHAELHIYGDLNQEEPTKRFILSACERDSRIKCCGTFPGEDIYQKMASIHALCIPSIWPENAPLVLLNALASETFVVVSEGKGLVEFVQSGLNGAIFGNNHLKQLTDTLRQTYERRNELGEILGRLPRYTLSPQEYGQAVYQIYDDILNGYHSHGSRRVDVP